MSKAANELMQEAIDLYSKKGATYGHTYLEFGHLMECIFTDGIQLKDYEDFNRFAALSMVVHKLLRYGNLWDDPERASEELRDMGVYSFILQEINDDCF